MATSAERLQAIRALLRSGEARRIREAAQLSQGEIAKSIGVDPSLLSRWERGVTRPTGEAALRYGALLDRLAKVAA